MKRIIFMGFLLSLGAIRGVQNVPVGVAKPRLKKLQDAFVGAIKKGDSTKILSLLERVNPRFAINEEENTPLHLAAALGRYKIVEMLIRRTSIRGGDSMTIPMDPNQQNKKGLTPLHFAVINLHPQVVRLLMTKPYATAKPSQFADPNLSDNEAHFPLDYLVNTGKPLRDKEAAEDIVVMLLQKEAIPFSALRIAARNPHTNHLVELFLDRGITVSRKWVESTRLNAEVKKLILAYLDAYDVIDATKNNQKKLNETLREAAKNNDYILAKLALKYGADKSAKSNIKRQTAYDLALKNSNQEMMKLVKP